MPKYIPAAWSFRGRQEEGESKVAERDDEGEHRTGRARPARSAATHAPEEPATGRGIQMGRRFHQRGVHVVQPRADRQVGERNDDDGVRRHDAEHPQAECPSARGPSTARRPRRRIPVSPTAGRSATPPLRPPGARSDARALPERGQGGEGRRQRSHGHCGERDHLASSNQGSLPNYPAPNPALPLYQCIEEDRSSDRDSIGPALKLQQPPSIRIGRYR